MRKRTRQLKTIAVIVFAALISPHLLAQERILLTPFGEAITINKGKSALEVTLNSSVIRGSGRPLQVCPSTSPVGRSDYESGNTNFGFNHGDVAAMAYVTPVSGVIESLYFYSWQQNGIPDSIAYARIMTANTSGYGSAAAWMGYWPDSTEPDVGRTPYPDEATGVFVLGDSGSFSPVGSEEIWGLGGYPIIWHTGPGGVLNRVATTDGYQIVLSEGDSFTVCIRLPEAHISNDRTEMLGINTPEIPFRFFKYYQHDRLPGKPGWWAREFDMYVWVVMHAIGDVPPEIDSVTVLHHTLFQERRTVQASAIDCNPGDPGDTGVGAATLWYGVNGSALVPVPMTLFGGWWQGDIPAGLPLHSLITYQVSFADIHGNTSTSGSFSYRIVGLNRNGYITDHNAAFNYTEIRGTGTAIQEADWFNLAANPQDDGIAGPFDMGGPFTFFGTTVQYAWFGVNGAVTLTNSPTDTEYTSASGSFTNHQIPGASTPTNFVGVFWNDLIFPPLLMGYGHGVAYHQVSGNQFICEWDSVGDFNNIANITTSFQIIFDRSDNSVTFNYLDNGSGTLDMSALIGMQNDVSNWLFANRFGWPIETRGDDGSAIKFTYIGTGVNETGDGLPARFALHANYPNPFNPSTSISYDVPRQVHVSLKVYNLLGQEVATLVDRAQQAGRHEAQFDASGLSSGVYFYRLQAGAFVETRKLVLIK